MFTCSPTHRIARLVLVGAVLTTAQTFADSVFIGSLERKDVKITAVRDGSIEFSLEGRSTEPVPLTRVSHIALTDDAALNRAEEAFVAGKFAAAAEGYQASFKATARPWLKTYILPRMLEAANKGEKFGVAVSAYIALVKQQPQAAQKARPTPPQNAPVELRSAVTELSAAASDTALSAGARQAIQSLLLEVYRTQNDLASAARLGEQILKSGTMDMNDPAAVRLAADVRIGLARVALADKQYDKAQAQIDGGRELFTDPKQQAMALFCLAQAADGKAGAKPDAAAAKDLAIAYMRVVAVARTAPDQPCLPESLYRVAQLHEVFGDTRTAAGLYADLAQTYADESVGKAAAKDVARLQQAKGS